MSDDPLASALLNDDTGDITALIYDRQQLDLPRTLVSLQHRHAPLSAYTCLIFALEAAYNSAQSELHALRDLADIPVRK